MKVFVTRRLPGDALERLAAEHDVEVWPEQLPPGRDELLSRAPELEGLLSLLTDPVDAELIGAAPQLRAISNYAVGVDNVDLEAAAARGIPVGNTPGVLTDTTADLAVALILGISRHLVEGDAYVRRGEWRTWEPGLLLGHDLHGSTVGIVGFGRIGQAVARRLEGFGCEILRSSRAVPEGAGAAREGAGSARTGAIPSRRTGAIPSRRTGAIRNHAVPLEELLDRSDFVSVHTPLTTETRGLIGDEALAQMKPTAYLVNTARGPIVDGEALGRALRAGRIAGAALDVTDPEPLPASDALLDAPNLLLLPHLGSATYATRERMADMAVDNLLAGLAGERMPHCVT